jgi:HTH-type transcriptional regulator/antitoxin HipB
MFVHLSSRSDWLYHQRRSQMHDRADRGVGMENGGVRPAWVPDPALRTARLAEAVRRRRESLGLRQEDLAGLARCSQRFVHTVEAGKATVRFDKLLDVLATLGLTLALARGDGSVTVVADVESLLTEPSRRSPL